MEISVHIRRLRRGAQIEYFPPPMKKLIIRTGLISVLTAVPLLAAAASPYCGERVCHSYDRNGACDNWTCFGDGGYYGGYGNYGRYDYNRSYRGSSYGSRYNYSNRYYNDGCQNRGSTYRGYSGTYTYDYDGCRNDYNSRYRSRSSRSSYYYDDYYYPRYDDRMYVPKAGYYYRY